MKVALLTATKGRHRQLERVVRFVLNQTVDNWTHIIFNNSTVNQRLNSHLSPDKFLLINNSNNLKTGKPYTTLGEIYNDIIRFIPDDCDVINHMDDDDIFLPNHVEEGLKGLERGGVKAYKPQRSWFKYGKKTSLEDNNLEPSIFVTTEHIKQYGYSPETTAQHLQWLDPLVWEKQIFADDGTPTYICDWSQDIITFKTSGHPNNPHNFDNYTQNSQDNGDGIITPCSQTWAQHYYKI